MAKLTKRQQEILSLIQSHMLATGSPPTRAEIAKTMGFRSPNAAEDHLRALSRKGVIELVPGTSRGIRLTTPINGIPLIKNLISTHPDVLLGENNIVEYCKLDRFFFKRAHIEYLIALGKNYPELNLLENDILAINKSEEPQDHDIVILNHNNEILIQPYNLDEHAHKTLYGIVLGTIRSFTQLPLLSIES